MTSDSPTPRGLRIAVARFGDEEVLLAPDFYETLRARAMQQHAPQPEAEPADEPVADEPGCCRGPARRTPQDHSTLGITA